MPPRARHLSRPIYEGLPWAYIVAGLGALGGSYLLAARGGLSLAVGLVGLASLIGGIVLILRRRDYRELRSQYGNPDSLGGNDPP